MNVLSFSYPRRCVSRPPKRRALQFLGAVAFGLGLLGSGCKPEPEQDESGSPTRDAVASQVELNDAVCAECDAGDSLFICNDLSETDPVELAGLGDVDCAAPILDADPILAKLYRCLAKVSQETAECIRAEACDVDCEELFDEGFFACLTDDLLESEEESDAVIQEVWATCDDTAIQCEDGSTIPGAWICDGFDDCESGIDEQQDCPPDFECPDQEGTIPPAWVCDGEDDCSDGSDEANCGAVGTSPSASARGNWMLKQSVQRASLGWR